MMKEFYSIDVVIELQDTPFLRQEQNSLIHL